MTPTETREILSAASGDRVASRLVASWAASLSGYTRAEVKAAVDAFIARHGYPPRLDQVRAALGAR